MRESRLREENTSVKAEQERASSTAAAHKAALDRLRADSDKQQREQGARTQELLTQQASSKERVKELVAELQEIKRTQSEDRSARQQSAGLVDDLKQRIVELESRLETSTDELTAKAKSLSALEHESQELSERRAREGRTGARRGERGAEHPPRRSRRFASGMRELGRDADVGELAREPRHERVRLDLLPRVRRVCAVVLPLAASDVLGAGAPEEQARGADDAREGLGRRGVGRAACAHGSP